MITVKQVSKTFGKTRAIDDISFEIKSGDIVGFLGPNGAGKTTTMRLLTGYYKPSYGTITIDHLNPIDDHIDVVQKIGYLPENNPLYGEMKVFEYLSLAAHIKEISLSNEIITATGIENILQQKIEELSRGYKQRVGLAAALLGEPELLILDEPTSGLDPLEQEKIRTLIKTLSKKTTVIFSTHILSEVEDVATKLIIIDHGAIVYDGGKPEGRGSVERIFKKLVSKNQ